jgi:CxxC-x17-CxxC domain-containing protein
MTDEITFIGTTTFRNIHRKFGIKTDDRRRHLYIIGKTGMGKTVLLENMAIQDIKRGYGIGFIDPHGEAAERLLNFIPSHRINDVVYFNPADIDHPIPFNVMEKVEPEYRHLVASGLIGAFKKIWPDVWSARMEYLLHNAILALLETPGSTILGINRLLADKDYREKIVEKLKDPIVKTFWTQEFARYPQRYEVEATAAVQNKVGQFISNPLIRNIVGQVKSIIDIRKLMDEGKILIINLSKGKVGEENSLLLGALMVTKLQLAAMSRVDIPEEQRRDFYLYVDEFQNFATEAFATILSEARKYRLSLILAHQYIGQLIERKEGGLSTSVRDAVFGNVGTIIAFRVGAEDGEFLEREFSPEFTAHDLVNLPKYNIYIKLMIDGIASRPFSAKTLPPFPLSKISHKEKIIKVSQERYGVARYKVEEKISRWVKFLGELPAKAKTPQPQVLYDAKCSKCGKDTKVVFPPEPSRVIYCKKCRKKHGLIKEKKQKVESLVSQKTSQEKEFISLTNLSSREEKPPKRPERKKSQLIDLRKAIKEALKKGQ